ncbi:MAG: DUF2203 domain-containing protein [Chloroflexi bacterium]|nr:DUF2203 domain-containing protein [Chloroflexota bacterium]MDA1240934.1 DUF2203 domain-containing protein [Chloroflexota bacterium]
MADGREFTLDEARAALRVVRSTVEALQATQRRLRAVKAELNSIGRIHLNNGVVREREMRDLRASQRRLGEDAQHQIREILSSGAEIKGIDDGLIDFPTTIEGVPAYWCWRAGEAEIAWWHPRSTGFSGRRQIVEP